MLLAIIFAVLPATAGLLTGYTVLSVIINGVIMR